MVRFMPTVDAVAAQRLQDASLPPPAADSAPVSRISQISGIGRCIGSPAIAFATSMPPRPIASMPSGPAAGLLLFRGGRITACPSGGSTVAGFGVPQPESLTSRAEKVVVFTVLAVGLHQIVVDVLHRHIGAGTVETERFQFEHHQGASRILVRV